MNACGLCLSLSLSLSLNIDIYIYIYIYICLHVCVCMYAHTHTHTFMQIHTYTFESCVYIHTQNRDTFLSILTLNIRLETVGSSNPGTCTNSLRTNTCLYTRNRDNLTDIYTLDIHIKTALGFGAYIRTYTYMGSICIHLHTHTSGARHPPQDCRISRFGYSSNANSHSECVLSKRGI
jgi:hypothetical protein